MGGVQSWTGERGELTGAEAEGDIARRGFDDVWCFTCRRGVDGWWEDNANGGQDGGRNYLGCMDVCRPWYVRRREMVDDRHDGRVQEKADWRGRGGLGERGRGGDGARDGEGVGKCRIGKASWSQHLPDRVDERVCLAKHGPVTCGDEHLDMPFVRGCIFRYCILI